MVSGPEYKGWMERVSLKPIRYHVQNRYPGGICCMVLGAQAWCSVMTSRGGMGWEVGGSFKRQGACVYL